MLFCNAYNQNEFWKTDKKIYSFSYFPWTGGKYSVEQQLMKDVVKGNVHIRPVAKSNETINVYIQLEVTQVIVVRKLL